MAEITAPRFEVAGKGPRWVKIARIMDNGQRTAHAFHDPKMNVTYAARSWKAPNTDRPLTAGEVAEFAVELNAYLGTAPVEPTPEPEPAQPEGPEGFVEGTVTAAELDAMLADVFGLDAPEPAAAPTADATEAEAELPTPEPAATYGWTVVGIVEKATNELIVAGVFPADKTPFDTKEEDARWIRFAHFVEAATADEAATMAADEYAVSFPEPVAA